MGISSLPEQDALNDLERPRTVGQALERAKGDLWEAGLPEPGPEAEYLLMGVTGLKRHELYLAAGQALGAEDAERLAAFIERRKRREPVQYITGEVEFHGLSIAVAPDVLVPRPETELLVDEALKACKGRAAPTVIDLCTGSGCVAVTVAIERPDCRVFAVDLSEAALKVAGGNARRLGVAGRVTFLSGDLFAPLEGRGVRADLIVTNPPYVPTGDIEGLEPEVRDFEPRVALDGGPDGLDVLRRIISGGPGHLAPGGMLLAEIGYGEAEGVGEIAAATGAYGPAEFIKDYSGVERIVRLSLR